MLDRRQFLAGIGGAVGALLVRPVPGQAAPLTTPMLWTVLYNADTDTPWQFRNPDRVTSQVMWSIRLWKQPEQTAVRLCAHVQGAGDVLLSWAEAGDSVSIDAPSWTPLTITTTLGPTGLPSNLPITVALRTDKGMIALRRATILIGTPLV